VNTTIAIYSHKSRAKVLDKTVAYLRDVGLEPDVINIQTAEPNQVQNRLNAFGALAKAFNGNPVLVLEDDIIPSPYLRDWIEWLEATSLHVTSLYACVGKFYNSEVRPFVEAQQPVPAHLHGLYELQGLRGWYGAQAVWIPEDAAEDILADKDFRIHEWHPYGPWDHALRRHLIEAHKPMMLTVPNIVQHQAPSSVVNRTGPRHTTPIFDAAALPPERK